MEEEQVRPAAEPACKSCGGGAITPEPVFAIGGISVRFPSPAVQHEYEFERASLPAGGTEHANLIAVLEKRPDLARLMCWIVSTQGLERFYLRPRSDRELQTIIAALKPDESNRVPDTHVVVGWKVGTQSCSGVELPLVLVETSYHFDRAYLLDSMFDAVRTGKKDRAAFLPRAAEVFDAIIQIGGNDGSGPVRALNWAAVRFAPLYGLLARAAARDEVLGEVAPRSSPHAPAERQIVDIVLTCEPRKCGASARHRLSVDASDLFPYPIGQAFSQAFDLVNC